MKIAQIAPLWETVPPKTYGGTELVVYLLSNELIRMGHDVTLYACHGSDISGGEIRSFLEKPLREQGLRHHDVFTFLSEAQLISRVVEESAEFDVIHNHLGFQFLPFSLLCDTPVVTTLHGVFEPLAVRDFVQTYRNHPYVSISDYQRKPCPDLNYERTVYHGLDLDTIEPSFNQNNDYLAFLGRFSPEKGVHLAIQLARDTGHRLVMAGKVDRADEAYFKEQIEPLIDGEQIVFIGEVNHEGKVELLRNARATLCLVTWPEPFGLVLVESMACGTPVIALENGSIPEIIRHGETGFYARSPEELPGYLSKIPEIDRRACRAHVEKNFSAERMASDYIQVYENLKSAFGKRNIEAVSGNVLFLEDNVRTGHELTIRNT